MHFLDAAQEIGIHGSVLICIVKHHHCLLVSRILHTRLWTKLRGEGFEISELHVLNKLSPVRHQMGIGACGFISAVAAMEMLSRLFLTLTKGYYFEINDLYDHVHMACTTRSEALELKLDRYGDKGTTMPVILSFIVQYGLKATLACELPRKRDMRAQFNDQDTRHKLHSYRKMASNEVMGCLKVWPIVACLVPYSSLCLLKKAHYSGPSVDEIAIKDSFTVEHFVLVVGHTKIKKNDTEEDCLIIQNSHGTDFGLSGFAVIPFDCENIFTEFWQLIHEKAEQDPLGTHIDYSCASPSHKCGIGLPCGDTILTDTPSRAVRFHVGHPKVPLEFDNDDRDHFLDVQEFSDDKFVWTHSSPEFPMAQVLWNVPCGGVCYGDGNLVFIANDWHTALLPVYLKAYYHDHGLMQYTRSVLVIHNIAHQGHGPVDDISFVDLPPHFVDLFKLCDPLGGEQFNIFAAGLKAAERVVTVSHGYSLERRTSEGGWGLNRIINESDWKLRGIVNGIDTKEWSPELDIHLKSDNYVNYSIETLKTGKAQCKTALQKELVLPIRGGVPLIGFIGRLDQQKGADLIADTVPWMMGQDVQLVMLGSGRPDLEQLLRQFERQYNDRVRGWVGFSVKTVHRIAAGADILLMPSRFEPCGLNQLYAMRYGTITVVPAVGGLRDTAKSFNPYGESGLAWTFSRADANELINALGNSLSTYSQYKTSWEGLQKRGMT